MFISRLSPVGLNVNETISLQKDFNTKELESLISCCLGIKSENLTKIYEKLRKLSSRKLKMVVSEPLFNVAISNLVRGVKESSKDFTWMGIVQLGWLIDSLYRKDFWAPFSQDSSIYLPFDGVFLKSIKPIKGLFIHRNPKGLFISIDGSMLEVKFNKKSNFLRLNLENQHDLIAWKFNEDVFRIDYISELFTPIVPEVFERECLSLQDLKKWSDSISKAVQLLQLCGLDDILTELNLLIRVIVPLKFIKDSHQSGSSPDFPGVICMSWTDDILQFLEAIIHEAAHNKLTFVEKRNPLTDSYEEIFRSPWREDLRPAHGLIHGSFAFLSVAVLWDSLLRSPALPSYYIASITKRMKVVIIQVQQALFELKRAKCLTETGKDVVESIRKIHSNLLTDCNIDIASLKVQRGGSSAADKIKHELSLLKELSNDCKWVLPLYTSTKKKLDSTIERMNIVEPAASIIKKRLPLYYLWWGLPLVEAFNLTEELGEAKFWMPLHICFGLIWRYVDEVEDNHSKDIQEQQMFYDSALGLLIENIERLKSRKIPFSPRLRRLLFQFYAYRRIEKNGIIKVRDIWRRASAFLVVPDILRGGEGARFRAYKEYCIFLGLLDDLEDGWEDLNAGRRTWVTQQLSTKSPEACRQEFKTICDDYKHRLREAVPTELTLWSKVLDHSFIHCDYLISKIQ